MVSSKRRIVWITIMIVSKLLGTIVRRGWVVEQGSTLVEIIIYDDNDVTLRSIN